MDRMVLTAAQCIMISAFLAAHLGFRWERRWLPAELGRWNRVCKRFDR